MLILVESFHVLISFCYVLNLNNNDFFGKSSFWHPTLYFYAYSVNQRGAIWNSFRFFYTLFCMIKKLQVTVSRIASGFRQLLASNDIPGQLPIMPINLFREGQFMWVTANQEIFNVLGLLFLSTYLVLFSYACLSRDYMPCENALKFRRTGGFT